MFRISRKLKCNFSIRDDAYHFMHTGTYEQMSLDADSIGEARTFLKENTTVKVLMFNGRVINIELPSFVVLEVAECEPGVKGDTVSGASKPAVLETGAKVQVPLFINVGDKLKIDTRSGEYVERA